MQGTYVYCTTQLSLSSVRESTFFVPVENGCGQQNLLDGFDAAMGKWTF